MARNMRIFTLNAQGLADMITEGYTWRCKRGVPAGSRIVVAQYDLITNRFQVAVEHPSFDAVPDGVMLPEFDPLFERSNE